LKLQLATALAAAAFVALALAAGPYRLPALTGALLAGLTGVASTLSMGRAARGARKPLNAVLVVFALFFLVRLVLVGSAVAVVSRQGWDILAFVVAFFVPYFVLSAFEAAVVHSLRRTVTPA